MNPLPTPAYSKEELEKLKKIKTEELNLKRIIDENEKRYDDNSGENTNIGRKIIVTPPERKCIKMLTSAFETRCVYNVLTTGDYVYVIADTSPGKNRPAGNAYITAISYGNNNNLPCASMKMRIDNRLYHDVPLNAITVANLNKLFN